MDKIDFKSPTVQKLALSIFLAVGVLGIFFFTKVLPFGYPNGRARLEALKTDYDKKSTELQRARATVADLPRFEAEYAHLHERWAMAAELLPTERQLPTLLRKITLAAQQTGVEFAVFRPQGAKTQDHYTELPLQLSVSGDYHQIGSFIAELANMRRIITVSQLQLRANTKTDNGGSTAAEFTASAYSLNASAASAAAAGATASPAPASGKEGETHARKS